VVFSTTIIFGHTLRGYRTWFAALCSIFRLLLGKFQYSNFGMANPALGPAFFFGFNILINWIVMNIFISILTDCFCEVQAELLEKENEYDVIDYMMRGLKNWLGFNRTDLGFVGDDDASSESDLNKDETGSCGDPESKVFEYSLPSLKNSQLFASFNAKFDTTTAFHVNDDSPELVNKTACNFVKSLSVIYFHHSDATKKKSWKTFQE